MGQDESLHSGPQGHRVAGAMKNTYAVEWKLEVIPFKDVTPQCLISISPHSGFVISYGVCAPYRLSHQI